VIEEAVEVRAIPPPPRGLLGEGPFDSCCAQGGLLQPGVLGLAFRDAYIAEYHTSSCCRNPLPWRAIVQQVCARCNLRKDVAAANRAQTLVCAMATV
jgi:hypothetical protein